MKLASILLALTISFSVSATPDEASSLCLEVGGVYEIFNSPKEQFGVCRIEQGLISSWTLLSEMYIGKTMAVQRFFNPQFIQWRPGLGNRASHYCVRVGGYIETYNRNGFQSNFCVFRDFSMINEWTLLEGAKVHKALARLLSP